MRTILLSLLSVCLSVTFAFAQVVDSLTDTWADSVTYQPEEESPMLLEQEQRRYKDSVYGKGLDSVTWKNLTKDLNYNDTLKAVKEEPVEESSDSSTWSLPGFGIHSAVTKYILFGLVIAVLLYLLYRLIGTALFAGSTTVKKTSATFEILHDDEQMMQKDLDQLLQEALNRKDYKTAIRILFIQSLQDLQTLEWIVWKKEKTNRDYLSELSGKETFLAFSSMVLLYEKAWYSESIATQEDLDAFLQFKLQLKKP